MTFVAISPTLRALPFSLLLLPHLALAAPRSATAEVSACFTPGEACAARIVDAIRGAHREIRVQAYTFTAPPILEALAAAQRRGVDVEIILDRINERETPGESHYSGATYMQHANVTVWIDDGVASIAHNKVVVIDGELVITGSYNLTRSAETRNAENVLFVRSPVVADWYLANWNARREHSRPYEAE